MALLMLLALPRKTLWVGLWDWVVDTETPLERTHQGLPASKLSRWATIGARHSFSSQTSVGARGLDRVQVTRNEPPGLVSGETTRGWATKGTMFRRMVSAAKDRYRAAWEFSRSIWSRFP